MDKLGEMRVGKRVGEGFWKNMVIDENGVRVWGFDSLPIIYQNCLTFWLYVPP